MRVPVTVLEDAPQIARSPEFKRGEAEIDNTVTVASVKQSAATAAALGAPRAPGCLAKGIGRGLSRKIVAELRAEKVPGLHFGPVIGTRLAVASTPGGTASGLRVTTLLRIKGLSLRLYFDGVTVRVGRAVSTITFANRGTPVTAATERRLTILTAERMRRYSA